jgi:hypothetical protein
MSEEEQLEEQLKKLWDTIEIGDTIYAKEGFFTKEGFHVIKSKVKTPNALGVVTKDNIWIPINDVIEVIKKNSQQGGRRRNRKSKRKTRSRYSRRN